jgi:hypothetical protein
MNNKLSQVLCLGLILAITSGCYKFSKPRGLASSESLSTDSPDCRAGDTAMAPSPIRRLSKRELINSLKDILGTPTLTLVNDKVALVPSDPTDGKFDNQSNSIDFTHVETLFTLAEQVGLAIVNQQPTFMGIGSCLAQANQQACMRTFIINLGLRLFRKPVPTDLQTRYLNLYNLVLGATSKTDAAVAVIASMIQSPQFYYLLELDGAPKDATDDVLVLTPYEIATRLSYAYTGSAPDLDLLNKAANGTLKDPLVVQSEARRLLESPKGRIHMTEYFRQYLAVDQIPNLNFSAEFLAGQSVTNLENQMVNEALGFLSYHTYDVPGQFRDLMTSSVSFVKSAELAGIYKVAPSTRADGMVTLTDPNRQGLLTRLAVLASANEETNPFHRGNVVYSEFACGTIGRPDPDAVPEAFDTVTTDGTVSRRVQLETLTSKPACMGCHQSLNSYGFAFESFDSIGRHRTEEILTGVDNVVRKFTIDAQTRPTIDGIPQNVNGAVALGRALGDSRQGTSCFSKKWYRFTMGRLENSLVESCTINKLAQTANTESKGIKSMFLEVSQMPQFLHRVKPKN